MDNCRTEKDRAPRLVLLSDVVDADVVVHASHQTEADNPVLPSLSFAPPTPRAALPQTKKTTMECRPSTAASKASVFRTRMDMPSSRSPCPSSWPPFRSPKSRLVSYIFNREPKPFVRNSRP